MNDVQIDYNCLEKCGDRDLWYVIYIGDHKAENQIYRVIGYNRRNKKICTLIIPQYANCEENYQVTAFKYPAWLKAQLMT